MSTRQALALALCLAAWTGPAHGQDADPATPAPTSTGLLPATVDFRLENGMRVFLVPNDEVPLVSFEARVAGGSVEDPPGRSGATALLAELLAKGAGKRDAAQFQEAVDFVGATFGTAADKRWITVAGEFLAADVPLGLDLLADALRRPRLDAEQFEQQRGLFVDGIAAARGQPEAIIGRYWNAWRFAGHPYARPTGGDETSLAALTRDDVVAAGKRCLAPGRVWLAIAGDFDPPAMRAAIAARFGDWEAASPAPAQVPAPKAPPGGRVLRVDKPDALQTYFRFGGPGIDWSHPAYPARFVANTVLGGRFTSRLNTALRIRSGLTYGAWSGFADGLGGAFTIGSYTRTESTQECLTLASRVYAEFRAGITLKELASARRYVKGQYAPDNLETADQVASMILALEFDGLPRTVIDGLFERLDALTLAQVNDVIAKHFPADALRWVVIGRGEAIDEALGAFGERSEADLAAPGFGAGD